MKKRCAKKQAAVHTNIALATRGFSLSETLIALAAGTLVIGGGAAALQSMQTLIKNNGEKTAQRQNITNGVRLMRSEIERSLHTLVNGAPPDDELAYTDLGKYTGAIDYCRKKSIEQKEGSFIPLFGLKMSDVMRQPVIYGLSEGTGTKTFSLKRCGTQLGLDGRYDNSKDPFVASVIDGISMMPCLNIDKEKGECLDKVPKIPNRDNLNPGEITSTDILNYLVTDSNGDYYFNINSENKTEERGYLEPAFRFETDENRKLIRVIPPMDCDISDSNQVCVKSTMVNVAGLSESGSQEPLMLTAYTRADKNLITSEDGGTSLDSKWFRDVNSRYVRFLVDGSGSMSACMSWSYKVNGDLEMGDTIRTFHTPSDGDPADPLYKKYKSVWADTYAICNETRMERLKTELSSLIRNLPEDTKVGLEIFSTTNKANNRQWERSKNGLVTISSGDNRDNALAFIESLDDPSPHTWGGTDPWDGLQRAFDDDETDTLYFLSDGLPTEDLYIGNGMYASYEDDYKSAAGFFSSKNKERKTPLKVNTTSVKLNSQWMENLSDLTSGKYLQSK